MKEIVESYGLGMAMGSLYIPKEDDLGLESQGEDSHFLCEEKNTFGLANGVGGWILKGIDSGEYSSLRQLMNNSLAALNHERKGCVHATRVLEEAYYMTKSQGSSTACIITLNDDNCLHAVNVGDSGFVVFRNHKCIFQSPLQQHEFNYPYQLGTSQFNDSVNVAMQIVVSVQFGDVTVAGTDGLLDNMFPSEIEEIITKAEDVDDQSTPGKLAWTIAEYALYNSFDSYSYSPFSRAAQLAGKKHVGGKIDDISVIFAKVI